MDAQKKEEGAEKAMSATTNHMLESIQSSLEMMEHLKEKLSENDFILIASEMKCQYIAGYVRRQDEQRIAHAAFQKELQNGIAKIKESLDEMETNRR